jgi:hypothetical protein
LRWSDGARWHAAKQIRRACTYSPRPVRGAGGPPSRRSGPTRRALYLG